jgi:hypothetical protein
MRRHATSQSSLMRPSTSQSSLMRHATSQSSLMRHAKHLPRLPRPEWSEIEGPCLPSPSLQFFCTSMSLPFPSLKKKNLSKGRRADIRGGTWDRAGRAMGSRESAEGTIINSRPSVVSEHCTPTLRLALSHVCWNKRAQTPGLYTMLLGIYSHTYANPAYLHARASRR